MIEKFILRLTIEVEKLDIKIIENNNKKIVYQIITNIINKLKISQDEISLLADYINNDCKLNAIDKETMEFITYTLPLGIDLDDNQIDTLERIKDNIILIDNTNNEGQIEKISGLIKSLESNSLFYCFDDLVEIAKQYNYSTKNIYMIVAEVIRNNYNLVQLKQDEEVFNKDNGGTVCQII